MGTFFVSIYNFFARHKAWLWTCTIASFLLAGFFASRIRLEEDITRILPQDKTLDKLQQVFNDSRFADKLVITISQKDTLQAAQPDSLTAFAHELSDSVTTALSPYIKQMQTQVEDAAVLDLMQVIQDHLPVFLEEKDYHTIDSLITPQRLQQTLENNYRTLISPAGLVVKKVISADPVGMSWLGIKKLQHLQYDEQFELYDGFVMTKNHQHLMMFITPAFPPSATGKNAVFLKKLQSHIDSLQKRYPQIEASFFGGTAVSAGNAQQLRQDTMLTQGITVILLVVLIALFFRKKRAPLLVMLPVVFGALFSLACVYLIQGSISVIALGAGAVVLGIAVNYSLHVFNHYRHLPDIREVIKDLATPMTLGSFTTIGGFLCLELVQSPILQDVGLFAALSLVGAALFSLIFLPHWIVLGKQPEHAPAHSHNWLDKIAAYKPEKNKYLVGVILILTVVFFFTARKVGFESDMMRMNFMRPELKEAENKFNTVNAYTAQSIYLVTDGNNIEEALQHSEQLLPQIQQLQQEGIVKKSAGVNALLISEREQQIRINRWKQYWTNEKQQLLINYLREHGPSAGYKAAAFDPFAAWLHKDFTMVPDEALHTLRAGPLGDFITEKRHKVSLVTLLKVDPKQKAAVYEKLQHDPNTTVLDKQYVANRLVQVMQSEFNSIAWMTSLLVFFALLLSYGRIELALITFIPMLVSWVWILGIMGLFGIRFNIVNIILSTFIFGLGDDYSIFTMDGLLQQYKSGKEEHLSSFRSSIFLSAITTILGLGVMIFAKHPSLQSIALISIIGISCVVLISQVLIPFLFNWLITNRTTKGKAPWTLSGLIKSVFAFSFFVMGSLLLTVLGFVLIKLNPFNKEKGKVIYHKLLSAYTWAQLYIMGNVKKRIINPLNEQLDTPAVIISNHQSFLDILVSTMLHPKVILLTNEWVWNSPVFGAVVRLADYYPVAEGAEGSIEKLRDRVKQGYSIVVYPEGTRSPDAVLKRFHKGAFYIAEQLGLDILPIVLHGTAFTMEKNDFLLKDGTITVKYLPRIKVNDSSWGDNYSSRTKQISRYFKEEYEVLRAATETPAYFRQQLIYQYIYKGPVLEWYMRIKTKMENNYELFHQLLPENGRILDIGCGYGFLSYMLQFMSPNRQIMGVDYDEDKISTAQHNYIKSERLNFAYADITNYTFDNYDAFVISDVLHYLPSDDQEKVLAECINHLNPGGVIVVRDGDLNLEKRHERTRLTEFFSTKLIGFNKTQNELSFFSSTRMREIVTRYGATMEQIDNTKYTSNVIFIIKKSP
ncbi:1-acyl-sn-glycerol-3-phosphate acyltransferases [Chitinophaga sp. YR573]|uniref:trifunctional MMPL family transporter/lysophospholipid acyltransferase/class I SAM-dependent methyltransferase n=1 Tax=Chitinophaga sp. YR573 TaxID=1881040 RepID=UPI0008D45E8D|nr:trifunctional MMPL family transporter/lysophospholipid acyltransferase/class I SAM-dependent methyltransferase [Chitinophaga sp. YR573]SEW22986.1 1-acyl-sn-glycerol-3-phosphate acyltransferases [Chitinophaga sp. YR573]